jgi:hypothetical protein
MSNFALSDDAVVLGFDPGGERSFGAAVLFRSEFAATTVGCVRDALTWAIERCGARSRAPVEACPGEVRVCAVGQY